VQLLVHSVGIQHAYVYLTLDSSGIICIYISHAPTPLYGVVPFMQVTLNFVTDDNSLSKYDYLKFE
jgi:hypothetical protein